MRELEVAAATAAAAADTLVGVVGVGNVCVLEPGEGARRIEAEEEVERRRVVLSKFALELLMELLLVIFELLLLLV